MELSGINLSVATELQLPMSKYILLIKNFVQLLIYVEKCWNSMEFFFLLNNLKINIKITQ